MIRRPPRSTRTDTLFPYTTLFRSSLREALEADTIILAIPFREHREVAKILPNWDGKTTIDATNVFGVPSEELDGLPSRSEEHTSELQSLMRISYAVFCLTKKTNANHRQTYKHTQKKHTNR